MDFSGRHIVVTGGGSGVGAEIATQFAAAGAAVSIFGRRKEPLAAVAALTGATAIACDVTDRATVDRALNDARAKNGPVYCAIANAGAAVSMPFSAMKPDDLNDMLAVNLTGVFNLWQAVMPDMKAAGDGRMIAVASTAGLKGYPYVAGYCAAKHGVIGLTRALSLELAKTSITVNAICPGFVDTPMLDRSLDMIVAKTGLSRDEAANTLKANNPQGRFVQVDEVASAALWLASDGARSVNGHVLPVSGGEI